MQLSLTTDYGTIAFSPILGFLGKRARPPDNPDQQTAAKALWPSTNPAKSARQIRVSSSPRPCQATSTTSTLLRLTLPPPTITSTPSPRLFRLSLPNRYGKRVVSACVSSGRRRRPGAASFGSPGPRSHGGERSGDWDGDDAIRNVTVFRPSPSS